MDITSANAVIMLSQPSLFTTPVQLVQFSTDNIYETESVVVGESAMGVDGHLTAGFVNNPTPQTYEFLADSPSNFIFDQIVLRERADQAKYALQGTVLLTGVGTKWTMRRGFLINWNKMPSAGKVLQKRRALIHWESVLPNPS